MRMGIEVSCYRRNFCVKQKWKLFIFFPIPDSSLLSYNSYQVRKEKANARFLKSQTSIHTTVVKQGSGTPSKRSSVCPLPHSACSASVSVIDRRETGYINTRINCNLALLASGHVRLCDYHLAIFCLCHSESLSRLEESVLYPCGT